MGCLKVHTIWVPYYLIDFYDMFFMIDTIDITSYADDNTPYSAEKNQCDLKTKLKKVSSNFVNGSMKMARKPIKINVIFCQVLT